MACVYWSVQQFAAGPSFCLSVRNAFSSEPNVSQVTKMTSDLGRVYPLVLLLILVAFLVSFHLFIHLVSVISVIVVLFFHQTKCNGQTNAKISICIDMREVTSR